MEYVQVSATLYVHFVSHAFIHCSTLKSLIFISASVCGASLRMWGLAPYAGASARVPSRMWVALLARYSSTTVPMARSTARS